VIGIVGLVEERRPLGHDCPPFAATPPALPLKRSGDAAE
jgi:hypothetical protein